MAAVSTTVDSLENTLSPFLLQDLKSTGESKAVAVLSPLCVNAIWGNSDQQGGWIKAAMKKSNEMSPSIPKIKDCDAASKRKGHDRVLEDAHWNASEDHGEAGPIDAGSCPSSPEYRVSSLSGERIFFWSNAAFNQQPLHEETVCISKETAPPTSCSLSGSSSHHKAAITGQADREAESKTIDQDPLPETDGGQSCNANGHERESPIVDSTADAAKHRIGNSEFSDNSLARKLLFENDKSSSCGLVLEPDYGAFPYLVRQRSETKEYSDLQKSNVQATRTEVEIGLDEIEQEIQRLTERLTELQLQKRAWEKEMRRHGEETTKKAETASYVGRKEAADRERSVVAMLQQRQGKRSAVTGSKRGKGAISISSNSASVLQSPRAQSLRSYHEVVLKLKEETPVRSRRGQCPATSSASKLSELRRSVSSASRRMESSNRSSDAEAERSKVLRRLSMGSNVQGQQQQQRSLCSKGGCTPSRVVSSRYGRAMTPDACRPSGGSTIACKKRDRQRTSSAASSPMPQPPARSSAASSPMPQPPASVASSPLKKVATLRSGYPSRSGFVTPTKERQQQKPVSSIRTASNSSSLRAQNLQSPSKCPVARIDSPKSTAALYKCLESLLEDSKHFFKRPRSHLLHTQLIQSNMGANYALPTINTCRVEAVSPRDSGCVKRVCDRHKRHFFFASQESLPHSS